MEPRSSNPKAQAPLPCVTPVTSSGYFIVLLYAPSRVLPPRIPGHGTLSRWAETQVQQGLGKRSPEQKIVRAVVRFLSLAGGATMKTARHKVTPNYRAPLQNC